ncbi:glycosyltransferase [Rhodococcoides corynebacterioides]|uniref:glycosyltransferase n=1 Tax=Rhodococcoides corynebacterioides TaxID=53972 RepID=UPI001C9A7015|nr:glycosyltransferase [Rhodococcus corynebacterioides]MBY6349118.1 glycosyltransferase [Rhodococcus corynebacterioides]
MFFVASPNYNYGRFVGDAVVSVRSQQGGGINVRHHVQDGLSSDNTVEVLERHKWAGLTYRTEPDSGQCDALNKALGYVDDSARFIAWLNSDEYYLPGAFAKVSSYFANNPDIDVLYGDSLHVGADRTILRLVAQHGFRKSVLRSYGTFIQTSSTFYRREILDRGDLVLDPTFKQVMDLELFMRLSERGYTFGHLPEPLSAFRIHPAQLTTLHGVDVARAERSRIPGVRNSTAAIRIGRYQHRALKVLGGCVHRERRASRTIAGSLAPTGQVQ